MPPNIIDETCWKSFTLNYCYSTSLAINKPFHISLRFFSICVNISINRRWRIIWNTCSALNSTMGFLNKFQVICSTVHLGHTPLPKKNQIKRPVWSVFIIFPIFLWYFSSLSKKFVVKKAWRFYFHKKTIDHKIKSKSL